MKGQKETQYGSIQINREVLAQYAGSIAIECFGIVGMASVNMRDGLVKLLKRDKLTNGIEVLISEENRLIINFHVIVAYGVNIAAVADNLIQNVTYKMREYCDMDVEKVRESFQALINRHEGLRTSFGMEDGELVQRIAEEVQ